MIKASRMVIKRLLTAVSGRSAEHRAHGLYHALLRRTGYFGLNETAVTQEVLGALAGQAGTLLDVGVNIGRYSWFMAHHRSPGVPLYGFEPNSHASALARRNLAGLPDVTLLEVGLAERDRSATLAVPRDAAGNPVSGLGFVHEGGILLAEGEAQSITLKSLDGLIDRGIVRVAPPVLLKMDIEGYEPAALAGMARFLAQHRPWIFFECEPHHLRRAGYDWPALFTPLHALGYLIFAETEGRFVPVHEPLAGTANYFALDLETVPPLACLTTLLIR